MFVIARNSSFIYKGRAVDVKQVGQELGVRYVLEGSVRKSSNRVRITGQFIDAATGAHLWADRFDGALADIFELQDRCAASVVNAIAPRLEEVEIQRARAKPTEHLGAYDHYLRGLPDLYRWERAANEAALRSFRDAITLDPDYASPYATATLCYVQRKANNWLEDMPGETAEALRLATQAAELGKNDAECLALLGRNHRLLREPSGSRRDPDRSFACRQSELCRRLALQRMGAHLARPAGSRDPAPAERSPP